MTGPRTTQPLGIDFHRDPKGTQDEADFQIWVLLQDAINVGCDDFGNLIWNPNHISFAWLHFLSQHSTGRLSVGFLSFS